MASNIKHPGQVICCRHDPGQHKTVEVVDTGTIRTLYFGTRLPQTRMDTSNPSRLVSEYAKHMMAILPYPDQLKRILMVGLGGGGLVRFIMHHFAQCQIEVVEPDKLVIDIARDYFFPTPGTMPKIHFMGGLDFVHTMPVEQFGNYDLILVDAFDAMGMARSVHSASFFLGCLQRLSHNGVVAVNLATAIEDYYTVAMQELVRVFGDALFSLPVKGTGNVLALAGTPPLNTRAVATVHRRACLLQERLQLPLTDYINRFVPQKKPWWTFPWKT